MFLISRCWLIPDTADAAAYCIKKCIRQHNSTGWLSKLLLYIYKMVIMHLQTAAVSAFIQHYLIFIIPALPVNEK